MNITILHNIIELDDLNERISKNRDMVVKKINEQDNRGVFRMLFPKYGQEEQISILQLEAAENTRRSIPEQLEITPQIASFLFYTEIQYIKENAGLADKYKIKESFLTLMFAPIWTFAFFSPQNAARAGINIIKSLNNLHNSEKEFERILQNRSFLVSGILDNYQLYSDNERYWLSRGKYEIYTARTDGAGGRSAPISYLAHRIRKESVGISPTFDPSKLPVDFSKINSV